MAIETPREVIRTQVASNNSISPVGAEIMANLQQAGRSKTSGEAVTVSSNPADLTDALEELGMARATRGKDDLKKMQVRKGAGTDFEALGRIAEYYDKLPNLPSGQKERDLVNQFQKFQEQMLRNEGGATGDTFTADDILKLLQNYDDDITHQFAALENIRKRFGDVKAPQAFLRLIDQARQALAKAGTQTDIKAGFHSAQEAAHLAGLFASDAKSYRDSYRDMLRSAGKGGRLGDIFKALGDFLMSDEVDETDNHDGIIDSFIKIAGDDMKSFGPSTDATILGDVLEELNVLKNLKTTLSMGKDMSSKMKRIFPKFGDQFPYASSVVAEFLNYASSAVPSAIDAENMTNPYATLGPDVAVVAVNLFRDMHAALPNSAIPSDIARLQQSKVLLTLSDKFVAAEEASFGQQA